MARRSKKRKFSIFIFIRNIVYFLLLLVFYLAIFIKREFNDVSFEQLMYTFLNTEGANYDIVFNGVIFVFGLTLSTAFTIFLIKKFLNHLNISAVINLEFKGKKIFNFDIFKVNRFRQIVCFVVIVALGIWIPNNMIGYNTYVKTQKRVSGFFENYYVEPSNVNITFTNGKRNLIYIFVESLESSNVSISNGGLVEQSYIPNLENYALNNINFSHSDSVGGFTQLKNTEWTMAGLLGQTSGIPLKIPVDGNEYDFSTFMPGAYSIGQILEDNGYKNYFMCGSDASFANRRGYFEQHGNYEILDYYWAIDSKLISKDYYQWWGYEDYKLFDYAKNKLLEISKNDEPFNFTLLTADTHFIDGYMDSSCSSPFSVKYANSFHCSDSKIYNFIEWIKKQDFYENTTIVIVGDHLTMQSNFYDIDSSQSRYIFNTFINSAIETSNSKNRQFSHFDLYPTTLAAMGATIEGNKLALGVNLFSDEKTLIEKLGVDKVNEKLSNKSNYYNDKLLGNSYGEMLDKIAEEEKQANIEKCGKEVCEEETTTTDENVVEGDIINSTENIEDKSS